MAGLSYPVLLAFQSFLGTICIFLILGRYLLCLRVLQKRLETRDYLVTAALLACLYIFFTDIYYAIGLGLDGKSDASFIYFRVDDGDATFFYQLRWASHIVFSTALYLCKAAILSLLQGIFATDLKPERWILWVVILYVAFSYLAAVFILTMDCRPTSRNWAIRPEQRCYGGIQGSRFPLRWALHASSDVMIFALSLLVAQTQRLRRRHKYGLLCIYMLGAANLAFCCARLIAVITRDLKLEISIIDMLRQVEAFTAVMIASLPSLAHYLDIFDSGRLQNRPRSTSYPPNTIVIAQTRRPPQEFGRAEARTLGVMGPSTVMERPSKAGRADLESGVPTAANSSEQSCSKQNLRQGGGSDSGRDGQSPPHSLRVSQELCSEDATINPTAEAGINFDFYRANRQEGDVGVIKLENGKDDGGMRESPNPEEVIDATVVHPSHSRGTSESGATAVSRISRNFDGDEAANNGSKNDHGGMEVYRVSDDKRPPVAVSEMGGSRGHHQQYGHEVEDPSPKTLPPDREHTTAFSCVSANPSLKKEDPGAVGEQGVGHSRGPPAPTRAHSPTGENKLHHGQVNPAGWPLPLDRRPNSSQPRIPNTHARARGRISTRGVSIHHPGPGSTAGKGVASHRNCTRNAKAPPDMPNSHPFFPEPQAIHPAHTSTPYPFQIARRKTTGSANELAPFHSPQSRSQRYMPDSSLPLRREVSVTGIARVVSVASVAESRRGSIVDVLPPGSRPESRRGSAHTATSAEHPAAPGHQGER